MVPGIISAGGQNTYDLQHYNETLVGYACTLMR